MQPPDVTTSPSEWVKMDTRTPLWKNIVHDGVYSTDGGVTFTIYSERYDPDTPRLVRESRKV